MAGPRGGMGDGASMIVHGRTLEQVQAAVVDLSPKAIVKLKQVPTSPLKLQGYISITSGADYRTKDLLTGAIHPWQPCYHFYQSLLKGLAKQPGTYPSITLNKYMLKPYNAGSKGQTALQKVKLVCAHGPLTHTGSIGGAIPSQPPPLIAVDLPKGEPIMLPMLDGAPLEPGELLNVGALKGKVRPIFAVCTSLYVLEYCKAGAARIPAHIGSEIPDHLLMRASHAVQWRNRVTRYAEHFANTFARNLFDYLTMAAFGEARYGQGSKFTFDVPSNMKDARATAYQIGLKYDPRDMLPKLQHVFNAYPWSGGYGGKKWGIIAKFAGEYFKPMYRKYPIVFADHCVDLAHNGGLAFNKGYILGNPSDEAAYMAMLNSKKDDTFMSQTARQYPITHQAYAFYQEGVALGLVPVAKAGFKLVDDVEVPSLGWGSESLPLYHGAHGILQAKSNLTPTPTENPIETYPVR